MTLEQLQVLIAVADRGGFTAAAEHLQRSQPSVSRVIAALEHELGASLFVRRRDGVAPTEAGSVALQHARETLRQVGRMKTSVAAIRGRISGPLRIASLPSATGSLLAVPLRAFLDRHPSASLSLFEGSDQEVRAWLDRRAADIGVVTLPAPSYDCVAIGSDEMVAVLPHGHALGRESTVPIVALAEHPMIFPTGGCGPLIVAAARRAGVVLRIAFEAREPQSILRMVAAGLGISVMPTLNLEGLIDGVVTRPLEPHTPRTLALAVGADPSPIARAFIGEAQARLNGSTRNGHLGRRHVQAVASTRSASTY